MQALRSHPKPAGSCTAAASQCLRPVASPADGHCMQGTPPHKLHVLMAACGVPHPARGQAVEQATDDQQPLAWCLSDLKLVCSLDVGVGLASRRLRDQFLATFQVVSLPRFLWWFDRLCITGTQSS